MFFHLGLVVGGVEDAIENFVHVFHLDTGTSDVCDCTYALCNVVGVVNVGLMDHVVFQTDQNDRGMRRIGQNFGCPNLMDVWQGFRSVDGICDDDNVGILVTQATQPLVLFLPSGIPKICGQNVVVLDVVNKRSVIFENRGFVRLGERSTDVGGEQRRFTTPRVSDYDNFELQCWMGMFIRI